MTPPGAGEHAGSDKNETAPVTAFVSWAHDDEIWEQAIATFVLKLRDLGIDADVDLFHLHDLGVDWTTYGPRAIEDNDFVLLAASSKYKERWEGRGNPRTGAGAVREANVLKAIFGDDRRAFQRRVKVVVLPGATTDDIPRELWAACTYFDVPSCDLLDLEDLLRTLLSRPRLLKTRVGPVPHLPPALLGGSHAHARTAQDEERGLRELLSDVEQELDTAPPQDTPGKENLVSRKSTIKAALNAVREREEGSRQLRDDLAPGTVLGGYRIERVIAHGGQGVVYAATQLELDRRVAVKVVFSRVAGDPAFRERFRQEARLAANIDHENILPVYDSGELPGGALYLAMKFVDGTDLSTRLRRDGAFDPEEARSILAQIAEAIDAAHAEGLIHRDVKPANVLLESRSQGTHAYLTDFGLARPLRNPQPLTSYHQIVGTSLYMAPEQIQGGRIDGRVDVYAFGCTMYECLTGKPPYVEVNDHFIARIPLPSESLSDIPRVFDVAVQRAMAKDPAQRAGSAGEVMGLLEPMPAVPEPPRDPAPEPRRDPVAKRSPGQVPAAARIALHVAAYAILLVIAYVVGRGL